MSENHLEKIRTESQFAPTGAKGDISTHSMDTVVQLDIFSAGVF